MRYDHVVEKWNNAADEFNQWDSLGEVEKIEFAITLDREHQTSEADARGNNLLSAEQLAEKFHTLYEGFAPEYGYKTRDQSAVPWAEVPEQNKKLMIRVCRTILSRT